MSYLYESHSWTILDSINAVKICDPTFFNSHETGIPADTKEFWGISSMKVSEKKDVTILYDGKKYDASFYVKNGNRAVLYWYAALEKELSVFESDYEHMAAFFTRKTETFFVLEMKLRNEFEALKNREEWILPYNPEIYDCVSAYNDLICIDWHQSKVLSRIKVDDIVYMYASSPLKMITHQCIVNKINVPELEISDAKFYLKQSEVKNEGPFIELQCVREFDDIEGLHFAELKEHGLKGNLQGAVKLDNLLYNHLGAVVGKQMTIERMTGLNERFIEGMMKRSIHTDYEEDVIPLLSDGALKALAVKSETKEVRSKSVVVVQRERSTKIAEYSKRIAKGICQLCNNPAPFATSDGKPYLESHHIVWLSEGGEDSIANTIALCPNCHKKMHIVNNKNDVNMLLEKAKNNAIK